MIFNRRFAPLTFIFAVVALVATSVSAQDRSKRPREESLLNGLKVLMWSDPAAKDVSVKIRVHAGSAFDPQGKEGVMRLLAENIFPTTEGREYFSEELGGSFSIDTTYDYIQINASATPDKLLPLLETLSNAIANMTIDKPTTAKLRDALTSELTLLEKQTANFADLAAAKRMFGTFPYGRPIWGTAESVSKIDFADLIDARQRFFTADNATMTVHGNFNTSRAWQAVRRYLGAWLKSDRRVPSTFRQPDPAPAGLATFVSPVADESAIRIMMRSVARGDKDFAAAKLFSAVLENRLRARLPEAFADSVSVRADEHVLPGAITVGFSAARNNIGRGNGQVRAGELVSKSITDPITEQEFSTARSAVLADWAKRDTATLWLDADTFKTAGMAGEAAAFERVALSDVQAFARRLGSAETVSVLVNTPTK